jgi:tetratricopeptide (TPR) repeat protein
MGKCTNLMMVILLSLIASVAMASGDKEWADYEKDACDDALFWCDSMRASANNYQSIAQVSIKLCKDFCAANLNHGTDLTSGESSVYTGMIGDAETEYAEALELYQAVGQAIYMEGLATHMDAITYYGNQQYDEAAEAFGEAACSYYSATDEFSSAVASYISIDNAMYNAPDSLMDMLIDASVDMIKCVLCREPEDDCDCTIL